MSVLQSYFNPEIIQSSPVQDEYEMVIKTDKDGRDITVFEKVDLSKRQKTLGSVNDWSITSLMKAGIDPKTVKVGPGDTTRLQGVYTVEQLNRDLDNIQKSIQNNNNK